MQKQDSIQLPQRVFQADNDFDDDQGILQNMNTNHHRTQPHPTTNLTHLRDETVLECKLSLEELKGAIRGSKVSCPGISKINNLVLEKLPDTTLKL